MAPTWELNIETYGYGKQRKVYDPDYEHVESSKFKEYERLEGDGYDENIKDEDHAKVKNYLFIYLFTNSCVIGQFFMWHHLVVEIRTKIST